MNVFAQVASQVPGYILERSRLGVGQYVAFIFMTLSGQYMSCGFGQFLPKHPTCVPFLCGKQLVIFSQPGAR